MIMYVSTHAHTHTHTHTQFQSPSRRDLNQQLTLLKEASFSICPKLVSKEDEDEERDGVRVGKKMTGHITKCSFLSSYRIV